MAEGTPVSNPAPVLVAPVPAGSSRTLIWSKVTAIFGVVVGLIPELIALLSDPSVAAAMNEFISPDARRIIAIILTALGVVFHRLRTSTGAPIAGSDLEAELAEQTTESALASAQKVERSRR